MTLAYVPLFAVGVAMLGIGLALIVGYLTRSRLDRSRPAEQRRAEVGPVWTQRAVLGALLMTLGFFLAVFGALLTFAGPAA